MTLSRGCPASPAVVEVEFARTAPHTTHATTLSASKPAAAKMPILRRRPRSCRSVSSALRCCRARRRSSFFPTGLSTKPPTKSYYVDPVDFVDLVYRVRVLMVIRSVVKPSAYFDSVTLMLVQREVRQLPGVEEAGAGMGTDANKELLRDAGLLISEAQAARPADLILAVRAGSGEGASAALRTAETLLVQRRETAATGTYRPKTVASAVRMLPGANLALISVPGRFAVGVARDALAAGLHVMLFSDNVLLQAEIELKQTAAARGLLMMGPDCGTAIIGGAGPGFVHRVRRGPLGVV